MLVKAIGILSLLKLDTIYLEVSEKNEGALEFYKQFRFRQDRVVPGYYENGDAAVVLYLPLKDSEVSGK